MKIEALTTDELETLIGNYQRLGQTDKPTYAEAKAELQRRASRTLDVDITRRAILRSARKRDFLTYGDIARENGVPWTKAYRPIASHLDEVMRIAHERGEPLLTAIVVNEAGRRTGQLEDNALKGFIEGAKRLGLSPRSPQIFLREQQRLTFDAAAKLLD